MLPCVPHSCCQGITGGAFHAPREQNHLMCKALIKYNMWNACAVKQLEELGLGMLSPLEQIGDKSVNSRASWCIISEENQLRAHGHSENGQVTDRCCGSQHCVFSLSCTEGCVYCIPFSRGNKHVSQTGRCINICMKEHQASLSSRDSAHLLRHVG